ncbi:MAG: MlaE family ABC transporter permease [Myxococcaceae bacterium]
MIRTRLQRIGEPVLMLLRTVRAVLTRGISLRECVVQFYEIGNRSVWLVMSALSFFGAVMVIIADGQARKLTGNLAVVGPAYFELLVREFGPITCTVLAAARAGAGTSAELSSMSVNEQVEALELSNGDPYADLVAPRVLASLLAVPVLVVIGTMAASVAAALTAQFAFAVDGRAFLDARYVDRYDLLSAGLKALGCGLYIPLAASVNGLKARGGSAAVGTATTDGVVSASVGCLVIAAVVGLIFNGLRV